MLIGVNIVHCFRYDASLVASEVLKTEIRCGGVEETLVFDGKFTQLQL